MNKKNNISAAAFSEKRRPSRSCKRKRVASALLAAALTVTILSGVATPGVFAAEKGAAPKVEAINAAEKGAAPKEEVVYAMLDAGGAVDGVYVVNSFGGGDVTDYGRYASVKMLNTNDSISLDGDRVHFSSGSGKVYYEGYLTGAEIPWDFSVRFYLDGKEYAADEIAGKSGALEIKISVKRNKACGGNFFDDYALQMTVALDAEKCRNIKADEATVVNVGGNKQLSYIALPGKEKEFVVTADVADFEMEPLSIGGVRMNIDVEFDDRELMDKVRNIQDAATKLDDGAGGVSKGAAKLKGGADSFTSGTRSLDDGAAALDKGVSKLKNGVLRMKKGVDKLNGNSASLTDGSAQVKSALAKIKGALSSVSASTDDIARLVGASSEIQKGIGALTDGLDSLKKNASYKQYKALMAQKGMDLPALAAQDTQAAAGIQAQLGGVDALIGRADQAGDAVTAQALKGLKQQMTQLSALLSGNSAALSGVGAFNESYFGTLDSGVAQLYTGAAALKTDYAKFHKAISDFADALKGLLAHVSDLTAAIDALTTKYNALDKGLTEYTDGVSAIAGGYSELVSGASSLSESSKKLAGGASKIHRSASRMTGGVKKLMDGIAELHGGTSKFRGKTNGMDAKVTDEITTEIAAISGGNGKTVSFVSAKNKNVTSVQFIIKTKAVKVKADEKKTAAKEKQTSFWRKLSHLFGR